MHMSVRPDSRPLLFSYPSPTRTLVHMTLCNADQTNKHMTASESLLFLFVYGSPDGADRPQRWKGRLPPLPFWASCWRCKRSALITLGTCLIQRSSCRVMYSLERR